MRGGSDVPVKEYDNTGILEKFNFESFASPLVSGLAIRSGAFENGGTIPRKYGYKNENRSPPLEISQIPAGTKSLALIMDDPDAMGAVGKVWVHWVVWNIEPSAAGIGENSVPTGCVQGMTDFDEVGYGGPAPPDREHTYVFKLYALDSVLDCKEGSDKSRIEDAIRGHILAEARLEGKYSPDR